ncbi:hypothetical protein HYFRA_00000701 [Hymenoscyphus fraxineus]|uniref:CN hydrolase domain-containing protein n=1 Tax=Hymenoscyphus fraxineus TaxID=746836 RepID=A0A9N9PM57_9HELO|nr:hypothetical protein HYFRA_00000701 [Hymenoscyphus fraxineus]
MRIGCLQFAPQVGDVDNNLNRADAVLSKANPKNLDLLVLPELCFSGYNFKSLQHITPFLEPTTSGITSLWARTTALKYNCIVTAGYPEKVDIKAKWPASPEYYNSAITVNAEGETVANYRKSFLYYTDETWALEGSGFYSGEIDGLGNVAMGICMDLNPYKFEAPWNAWEFSYHILYKKANLVVMSMAWLTREDITTFSVAQNDPDMETLSYWLSRLEPLIRAETVGEIIVVLANRCGNEGEVVYAGTSTVLGIQAGEVKVYGILGRGEKELLVVDTDRRPKAKLISQPNSAASTATDTTAHSRDTEASGSTGYTSPDDDEMADYTDGYGSLSGKHTKNHSISSATTSSDEESHYRSTMNSAGQSPRFPVTPDRTPTSPKRRGKIPASSSSSEVTPTSPHVRGRTRAREDDFAAQESGWVYPEKKSPLNSTDNIPPKPTSISGQSSPKARSQTRDRTLGERIRERTRERAEKERSFRSQHTQSPKLTHPSSPRKRDRSEKRSVTSPRDAPPVPSLPPSPHKRGRTRERSQQPSSDMLSKQGSSSQPSQAPPSQKRSETRDRTKERTRERTQDRTQGRSCEPTDEPMPLSMEPKTALSSKQDGTRQNADIPQPLLSKDVYSPKLSQPSPAQEKTSNGISNQDNGEDAAVLLSPHVYSPRFSSKRSPTTSPRLPPPPATNSENLGPKIAVVTQGLKPEEKANSSLPSTIKSPLPSDSVVIEHYQSSFTSKTLGTRSEHVSSRPRSAYW